MASPGWLIEIARTAGPLPGGSYRVMVVESDCAVRHRDFPSLEAALQYADDVASESDYPPPIAVVLDSNLAVVRRGRHYGYHGAD